MVALIAGIAYKKLSRQWFHLTKCNGSINSCNGNDNKHHPYNIQTHVQMDVYNQLHTVYTCSNSQAIDA